MCKKESYVLSAAIVVALVTMLFFPMMGTAGSLNPTDPPAPTMKTLDQIPPTWSQKLQCDTTATCPRFEAVLDGAGVLDKETGLVWEKSPANLWNSWVDDVDKCAQLEVDGRKGWHLPTIEQLASLADTSVSGLPKLPAGHPFTGVLPDYYWSATSCVYGGAWWVNFVNGSVGYSYYKTGEAYVWCVRGGQGYGGM